MKTKPELIDVKKNVTSEEQLPLPQLLEQNPFCTQNEPLNCTVWWRILVDPRAVVLPRFLGSTIHVTKYFSHYVRPATCFAAKFFGIIIDSRVKKFSYNEQKHFNKQFFTTFYMI